MYTYTTWKKSNSLIILKGFCFLQRLDFQLHLMIAVFILFILSVVEAILILHFFAELLIVYSCSVVWHLAKHCFIIWTLQCNQGKWLYNTIASTLLVNYIIRYPFITYPISDFSQTTWCLCLTSMKFSAAIATFACFIGLQCRSFRFLWSLFNSLWVNFL